MTIQNNKLTKELTCHIKKEIKIIIKQDTQLEKQLKSIPYFLL